jgi:hypothetical protein
MTLGAPITLTLYGSNDEVISEHSRAVITTRFLERAIDLSDEMEQQGQSKEVLNALDQLLVDFFGGQFTLDQVKDGGDLGEKMTVLYAMINRAAEAFAGLPAGSTPNPTRPGTKNPRRRSRKNGS